MDKKKVSSSWGSVSSGTSSLMQVETKKKKETLVGPCNIIPFIASTNKAICCHEINSKSKGLCMFGKKPETRKKSEKYQTQL